MRRTKVWLFIYCMMASNAYYHYLISFSNCFCKKELQQLTFTLRSTWTWGRTSWQKTHTFAQLSFCTCGVFHHQIWLPLSHAIKWARVLKPFSCQNRCSSIKFAAWIVIVGAGFPGIQNSWCAAENVHKQSANCSFGPRKPSLSLYRPEVTRPVSCCSSVMLWRCEGPVSCPGTAGMSDKKFSAEEKLLSQKRQIKTDLWVLVIRRINPPFVCVAWHTSSHPHAEAIELCSSGAHRSPPPTHPSSPGCLQIEILLF